MPEIGRPKVEIAILVHRAGLEDDDVHGIDEAAVIIRHLAQVERDVVAAAGVVLAAVVAGKMPAEHGKCSPSGSASITARGCIVRQERIFTFAVLFARASAPSKTSGWQSASAVVQPHAGPDEAGRVFRGDRFHQASSESFRVGAFAKESTTGHQKGL